MSDAPRLTIILPTYNEAENIAEFIPKIEERFRGEPFRLVVVDDDSPDGTAAVARGLGAALRYAYDRVTTPYMLSSDSDQSFGVDEMALLYEAILERGHDLVQGTRHEAGGSYEATSFRIRLKKLASSVGNSVVRVVAGSASCAGTRGIGSTPPRTPTRSCSR
jgi:dolichol-phosphate mannosyltransferase